MGTVENDVDMKDGAGKAVCDGGSDWDDTQSRAPGNLKGPGADSRSGEFKLI